MHNNPQKLSDRLVSFVSYLTVGWGGLIYAFIMYLGKKPLSKFLRFNIFQSIFISFLYFVLCMILGFISDILLHIPFINYLVSKIVLFFNRPFIFDYSIIQSFMIGLFIYMSVFSLFGQYPRVYKLSKIIDSAAR